MEPRFTIVLRGYDKIQVDEVCEQADKALASGDETARAAARRALRRAGFTVILMGYDREEVDQALKRRLAKLGGGKTSEEGEEPDDFTVVLRGYDMKHVDQALAEADQALASQSPAARTYARDALDRTRFELRFRGYSRQQVEQAVQRRLSQLR